MTPQQNKRRRRLTALVDIMRDGKVRRAADLAETLGVDSRTVYRDFEDLKRRGFDVQGQAGLGYTINAKSPPADVGAYERATRALALGFARGAVQSLDREGLKEFRHWFREYERDPYTPCRP